MVCTINIIISAEIDLFWGWYQPRHDCIVVCVMEVTNEALNVVQGDRISVTWGLQVHPHDDDETVFRGSVSIKFYDKHHRCHTCAGESSNTTADEAALGAVTIAMQAMLDLHDLIDDDLRVSVHTALAMLDPANTM